MSITIGQLLKKAREERYITLEKASDETRIRIVFLQALESDDYSVMPSAAQGRGFLRNYADYLNLDIDEAIAELQKNAPPPGEEISGPLPQINLVEMNVPPLTDEREEKQPPPFWTSWLARFQKTESTPEAESAAPVADIKKGETPPVEAEQAEARVEPIQSLVDKIKSYLLAKFSSWFKAKSKSKTEEAGEPVAESEPQQTAPVESAETIFAEIGRGLRARRELISLTLDEVERHTRMRVSYLKALEEGAFDKLPSPVQTRGMLANYAAFLDLNVDTVLLRFADAIQARHRKKYSETPRENIQTEVVTSMPMLRSFIAGDLIFGMVMAAIIFALAVWGIGSVLSSRKKENARATAPSLINALESAATPTLPANATSANDAPIATEIQPNLQAPTLGVNANIVISIFAIERAFVRISVDGKVAFEGRMAPRETQVYQAESQIEVVTGNAAALRVTYNGHDLGLMGNMGEVVSRVYVIGGVVTPTATLPPTPTETPLVTATPTATNTPTPVKSTATP